MSKKQQDTGNREPGTGNRELKISRRGVFGMVAGAVAVVASVARRRKKDEAGPRRRGFWIGHS